MPYIKKEDRAIYEEDINQLVYRLAATFSNEPTRITHERAGHLNYIFTVTLLRFYKLLSKRLGIKVRYSDYNEIIGVLECIKQEFYRRQVSEYEDQKIVSEGDVE